MRPRIIPIFLIALISVFPVCAQLNYTAKAYRSINADSLTVKSEIAGLQLMYNKVGAQFYDPIQGKWRCYTTAAGWFDCFRSSSGGGGFVTADNGLTASTATNVQLGGTLLKNTNIDGAGFNLVLDLTAGGFYRLEGAGADGLGFDPDQISASNDLSMISSDDLFIGLASSDAAITMDVPTGNIVVQSSNGDATLRTNSVGDDVIITAIDDISASATDITLDATTGILILNGQSNWQLTTGAAGSGSVSAGTGGILLVSSGTVKLEVSTGAADMTLDVDATSGRYLMVEGLPSSAAGVPTNGLYDSLGFVKRKH